MSSIFALWNMIWAHPWVRRAMFYFALIAAALWGVRMIREDAREDERDEIELRSERKRTKIVEKQNEQARNTASVRRDATAPDELPKWMVRKDHRTYHEQQHDLTDGE